MYKPTTVTASVSSNNVNSNSMQPSYRPLSSSNLNISHTTPIKQISSSALSGKAGMEALWTGDDDDDDEPIEMPDFHYNWLNEEGRKHFDDVGPMKPKEKLDSPEESRGGSGSGRTSTSTATAVTTTAATTTNSKPVPARTLPSLGKASRAPRSSSSSSIADHLQAQPQSHQTPPSYGLSKSVSGSAQSSGSSARVVSLTDASTVSGSSLVPTPPYAASAHGRTSLSSQGSGTDGSGGSNDRPLGRMYSSRPFQRHVSAPIGRDRLAVVEDTKHTADLSTSTLTNHTHTHTATVRPPLIQTTSASSVHDINEAAARSSISRNTFVTPGVKDRAALAPGTMGSNTRRLGGLARFGGPARRVSPAEAQAMAEKEEQERKNSVLMRMSSMGSNELQIADSSASPPRDEGAGINRLTVPIETPVAGPSTHRDRSHEGLSLPRRRSPPMARRHIDHTPIPEAVEYLDHHEAETDRQRSTSPAIMEARQDDYRSRQPLRAYHSENIPSRHDRNEAKSERPDPGPPQPIRSSHRAPESPPREYRTSPPAQPYHGYRPPTPPHAPLQHEVRPHTQTAPVPAPPAEASRHAPPPPAPLPDDSAAVNTNKRTFLVNNKYYERVGLIGKGGSSKVYSVLCPVKRTVLALKRVVLDRADPETYQSYTNEIQLLQRLRGHDRIIQLVEHQVTFSPGNRPKVLVMVMECGEIDFAMLLDEQRGKPLNFNFVGLYWQQMLQAVQAVHQENVVHTDLKPANFVLVKGRLKIIDFGIAKAIANDTVNIQRDQQIGTVNYMSPEAISKMTNLNVLKLSYPSDVWSLGCILYQMVYGSPPFQHIQGGPMPKMGVIADPNHRIDYPKIAIPRGATGPQGEPVDPASLAVPVMPSAIDTMRSCLAFSKEERLTIPALLEHEFLQPRLSQPALPRGTTTITKDQMEIMVRHVLQSTQGEVDLDHLGQDLFRQLVEQNS